MIEGFQQGVVEDLLAMQFSLCISIYLPTHRQGMETKKNAIRFKNLLRDGEKRLQERGLSRRKIQRILRPGAELLETPIVWQHLDRGLAVFITPETFRALTLPIACPEQVWVGTHFHIKPLVPLWGPANRFYFLALSRGQVRFYEADRWTFQEIELLDTPKDLDEFLRYDEAQEHLQSHTMPPGRVAGTAAMFHGQGNVADKAAQKARVDEYVKAVRNGVERHLAADNCPLVLVAPEYIQSIYREVSHYSHLLSDGLQQAPDRLTARELYDAVRTIAEPHSRQVVSDRLASFRGLLGTGHASGQIEQIVAAARAGRVQTLLLNPTASPGNGPDGATESEEESLDLAVRCTLTQGGEVYAVNRQDLPSRSTVGAIFRY